MKIDRNLHPVLGRLLLNNGAFDIKIGFDPLRHLIEQKGQKSECADQLWTQLSNFAADIEMCRADGVALGSTDPIGAIEDQIYRFHLDTGLSCELTDSEIRSLFCAD